MPPFCATIRLALS